MNKIIVHTDGGARGNPGPGAIGVLIIGEPDKALASFGRTIGVATNNVAEYRAVKEALEWIRDNRKQITDNRKQITDNKEQIQFFLDSTLVVNQLNGFWKIKDATLRNFLLQIRILESEINIPITYSYIPREKNWQADTLVNKALDGLL